MKILRNQKGYTLTELMVVVAIVGVVAAMAVPTYLSYLPHLRLNAAVRDIVSYIRSARAQAAVKGRNIQLNLIIGNYPGADTIQLLDSTTGTPLIGNPVATPFNVDIYGVTFNNGNPQRLNGNSATAWGTDQIVFTPVGSVINANGSPNGIRILVCSVSSSGGNCLNGGIESYEIDVNATTGYPKVCSGSGGSGWPQPCP